MLSSLQDSPKHLPLIDGARNPSRATFTTSSTGRQPDSPVSDILYTNTVPNQSHAASARSIIREGEKKLGRIDDEISRLKPALDCLTAERINTAEYLDGHRALLAPARALPPEISATRYSFGRPLRFIP